MKQETILKSRNTRLQNNLRRSITEGWWKLDGLEFAKFKRVGLYADIQFSCWFYCNLKHVRVQIENDFGLEPLDKSFDGETAWGECVPWVIEEITRMTTALKERVRIAQEARNVYLKALKQSD